MTREEFLTLANTHYDKLADLQSKYPFYSFKEGFVKVWTELGGGARECKLVWILPRKTSEKKRRSNPIRKNRPG